MRLVVLSGILIACSMTLIFSSLVVSGNLEAPTTFRHALQPTPEVEEPAPQPSPEVEEEEELFEPSEKVPRGPVSSIVEPDPAPAPYVDLLAAVGIAGQLGSVAGIGLGVWRYIADKRGKVRIKIGGLFIRRYSYTYRNTFMEENVYCIRLENKSSEGRVESCEGRIKVEQTDIDHLTVWMDNMKRYNDISIAADLILFRVSNDQKELTFLEASSDADELPKKKRRMYSELSDNRLSLRIGSANARKVKPYKKKIKQIIQNSVAA